MSGNLSDYIGSHITGAGVPDVSLASFKYNGIKVELIPAQMRYEGGKVYSAQYDGLRVTLEFSLYPADGAAEWVVRFANTGDTDSGRVSELCGMDVTVPLKSDPVYGSLTGDLCCGLAFTPFSRCIYSGDVYFREAANGRSSAQSAFPYFDICEDGDSSLICAIGWTGKWRSDIRNVLGKLIMKVSIADADFYLYPGETARSPRILLMADALTAEDIRRKFVAFERRYYSPRKDADDPDFSSLLTFQCFDRYYWKDPTWPGEEKQLLTADKLIEVGNANGYWFDAAWFDGYFLRGVGNYRYNPLLPHGIKPVADRLHESGLKCMLWFEPESVQNPVAAEPAYGKTTDFFRDHPEWLMTQNDVPKEKFHLFMVNLGIPEALEYVFSKISGIIEENGLDFYRQDYNQEPVAYWSHMDGPGRAGLTEIHHVEGLYRLWDMLRARFPRLVIDNCSSGGRRLDLEMLSRSVSFWRSDTICGPATDEAPRDIWDQNFTLSLSRYIPYHAGGTWFDDLYSVRSAASRGLILQLPLLDSDFDTSKSRVAFDEVIRTRRYYDGDFYELTAPTLATDSWAGYQCHLPESGEGMVRLFRRRDSGESAKTFALRGLDVSKTYLLTFCDENNAVTTAEAAGDKLAEGYEFAITLPRASLTVEYREK